MKKIIIKRPKPTISAQRIVKYGRQSSVKPVYEDRIALGNKKAEEIKKTTNKIDNKKEEKNNSVMMDTKQKIELANQVLSEENQVKAKRIKKDKGLIERKENTIILTEDNRELLKD